MGDLAYRPNRQPQQSTFHGDLFACPVVKSYFAARELEVYYLSFSHIGDQRATYPALEAAILDLLRFMNDPASLSFLHTVIFSGRGEAPTATRGKTSSKESGLPISELQILHPEGAELMKLPDLVNFDSLRDAYRTAAKRCHPDRGGSTISMQLINAAYAVFHEAISVTDLGGGLEEDQDDETLESKEEQSWSARGRLLPTFKTGYDYFVWLGVMQIAVYVDSWAPDKACLLLQQLEEFCRKTKQSDLLEAQLLDHFGVLIKIPERLVVASRLDEARKMHARLLQLLPVHRQDADLSEILKKAEDVLSGKRKLRFHVMHPCQAENMARLNIIHSQEQGTHNERFEIKRRNNEKLWNEFRNSMGGFVGLSVDEGLESDSPGALLVPAPEWSLTRVEDLSAKQRWEYFQAFGSSGTLAGAKKYLRVRCFSYLRSLIRRSSRADAQRMEREAEFLRQMFRHRATDFSYVLEAVRHFLSLTPQELEEKLGLIRKLERTEIRKLVKRAKSEESGEECDIFLEYWDTITFEIRLHHKYIELVKAPAWRLKLALETGSIYTPEELEKMADTSANQMIPLKAS